MWSPPAPPLHEAVSKQIPLDLDAHHAKGSYILPLTAVLDVLNIRALNSSVLVRTLRPQNVVGPVAANYFQENYIYGVQNFFSDRGRRSSACATATPALPHDCSDHSNICCAMGFWLSSNIFGSNPSYPEGPLSAHDHMLEPPGRESRPSRDRGAPA